MQEDNSNNANSHTCIPSDFKLGLKGECDDRDDNCCLFFAKMPAQQLNRFVYVNIFEVAAEIFVVTSAPF